MAAIQLLKLNDLVRVGRNYDGGYVISKSLMNTSSVLLSFGINDDWSFEEDFFKKSGIHCVGFDFSVSRTIFRHRGLEQIRFFFGDIIKRRPIEWSRFKTAMHHFSIQSRFNSFFREHRFFGYGIDSSTHDHFKKLDDILKDHFDSEENIFLKVDVEGCEYTVIDDIIRNKQRFHTFAMEIHGVHDDCNSFGVFLKKIEAEYYIYHVHANNYGSLESKNGFPDVIEISCVRKDLVPAPVFYENLSHLPLLGLDFPNDLKAVDFQW